MVPCFAIWSTLSLPFQSAWFIIHILFPPTVGLFSFPPLAWMRQYHYLALLELSDYRCRSYHASCDTLPWQCPSTFLESEDLRQATSGFNTIRLWATWSSVSNQSHSPTPSCRVCSPYIMHPQPHKILSCPVLHSTTPLDILSSVPDELNCSSIFLVSWACTTFSSLGPYAKDGKM